MKSFKSRLLSKRILARAIPGASIIIIAFIVRKYGHYHASQALDKSQNRKIASEKSNTNTAKANSSHSIAKTNFLRQFRAILPILIPSVTSSECFLAILVAILLVLRTSFDIVMLQIMTATEHAIISGSHKDFRHHLHRFATMMLPVSCVNCLLKYGHTDLVLRFRNRMTRFLYTKYLNQYSFYKVTNLDTRLKNVDQVMTVDVERFASSVVHLYGNISKPILDICIYTVKLSASIGMQGPSYMLLYLISSGLFLTWTRQPAATFTIAEQQLEGKYRSIHSRILTHAEEIAFYNGQGREQMILEKAFEKLRGVIQKSQQFRFIVGMLDNIVAKYFATIVGFWVVSKPFLDPSHPQHGKATFAQRMESYFRSGKMLIRLSKSMGCLVLSGREVTRLAAFTTRVADMINVLSDLSDKRSQSVIHESPSVTDSSHNPASALGLHPNNGEIEYQDRIIEFVDVPLVTPVGDVLIHSLNVKVESGMNVIVVGPNGCGKSSLFRVLGELWPIFGGKITKPKRSDLFYIPQRPYLSIGTLRDQIIYPHSVQEMEENGRTDEQLVEFLDQVQLKYVAEREAGLDSEQEWTDVLSGGEKQRVAMARLFYHKPQFAILDECTSAVSVDVEGAMYTHCCSQNITLFTVSHRKSLWKYHQYVLQVQ